MTTTPRRLSLGMLTAAEEAFFTTVRHHLEQIGHGIGARLRFVFPSLGMAGEWFDADAERISYETFRPVVDLETGRRVHP